MKFVVFIENNLKYSSKVFDFTIVNGLIIILFCFRKYYQMCEAVNVEFEKGSFEDDEPPVKKAAPSIRLGVGFNWNLQALANAADAVQSGGKSPVSALNELGVRVTYAVLRQGGPAHCPSFTVSVTVADMSFEGWGHSKREARAAAARACLAALLARAGRVLPPAARPAGAAHDFTSDEPHNADFQCLEAKKISSSPKIVKQDTPATTGPSSPLPSPAPSPSAALFGSAPGVTTHKSPINLLYENYPGLSFTCTFGDGSPLDSTQVAPMQLSHSMRFKVVCQIKEQKFEGYGSSKKLAKLAAARSALAVLEEGTPEATSNAPQGFQTQTLADHIGKLVNEKFNELMKGDLVHSKRKVLAGIVMTVNNRTESAKVITVTTGTKCVSGEHMSVRGRAVNDCHAEVAARRCLQRHLYAQLLKYANSKDPRQTIAESDIEPIPTGGYQMKPDRQVHLYVSTAPCGDGRIFSPHEHVHAEPDRHPNRLARGQLRTKIESGEGTIPVKNCTNILQTWDGVLQGERLLTMSCSDKVARWCVVGLQGSLLSRYLKPVYLHSLVLGSLLHPHHMYRALCGRIESYIALLPPPFRLHRPLLARAASTEARTPARAPSFSVCWAATTPAPEVINATTGKLESGQPSLLCKQSMFARWQYLYDKIPPLAQEGEFEVDQSALPSSLDNLLYNEAKMLCPAYQAAKDRLIEAFEKAKLGRWIKKPIEQDQFVCEITNADPTALFA
ncbi:double-stranded RNA-specific editase Adar isoform X2 [Pectinophora gossypiella]|uniref:double-stranded RNA-specific editase Adar isoform X2 n=1 Tax=Pectinophora gossypiella TaxID=13191 RepID=UPI00214EEDD8|nr:double-stranded RNA-specific editase Adar isoform X2 [Pectinophora gossypiella]